MFLLPIKSVGGIKSARDALSFKISVESRRSSKSVPSSELQKNPKKSELQIHVHHRELCIRINKERE